MKHNKYMFIEKLNEHITLQQSIKFYIILALHLCCTTFVILLVKQCLQLIFRS